MLRRVPVASENSRTRLQAQSSGGRLGLGEEFAMQRVRAVHEAHEPRAARQNFTQEFDGFTASSTSASDEPVTLAPGRAGFRDEPRAQRVASRRHHDRNPVRRLHRRLNARRRVGDDDVHVCADQCRGKRRKAIDVAARRKVFDRSIASVDIPQVAERLTEPLSEGVWRGEQDTPMRARLFACCACSAIGATSARTPGRNILRSIR